MGVTLLAIQYLWIGCFWILFFPLIALTGGTLDVWKDLAGSTIHSTSALKFTGIVFSLIWFLAYVAYAILGFGLWKLRNFGRQGFIAINAFLLVVCAIAIPIFASPLYVGVALDLGILPPIAWIIWYLNRPRVRYAFGVWHPPTASPDTFPPGLSKVGKVWVSLGPIASFALFVLAIFVSSNAIMRSTGAYQIAMRQIQDSPCATSSLGTPIESGWMMSGTTSESKKSGSAEVTIPIHGPKGKGNLNVEAKKSDGKWSITSMTLDTDSGQKQLVPQPASGGCQ